MQDQMRRTARTRWSRSYRRYVRAVLKGDIIDFIIEAKRSTTLLKVREALLESLKQEPIVEEFLEPPPLLDPWVIRVKIKKNAFYRDVDRLIEKYAGFSHYAP